MIRIARVLCPVDFSDISRHALDHAAAIALWYEARLTVLYVFAAPPTMDLPPLTLEDAERQRLLGDLRALTAHLPPGLAVDLQVTEAPFVHEEIVSQVGTSHADLLVLGTHGRTGFQRLFLGSVTEKVMRKAQCPTLVVPPRAPDVPVSDGVHFKRILCAVDFSDRSLDAVTYAITMAEEADAHLTLLHVVEIPPVLSEDASVIDLDVNALRESAAADARARLQQLIPEQARTYCTVETSVVKGNVYREVLAQAEARDADVIVMGAHGRGAIDRLVFGSTTHHVIRAAVCPVLVVRHH